MSVNMIKLVVETKSRSKRVFEIEDDEKVFYCYEVEEAFKEGTPLYIKGVFFNTPNITLVEFQLED